MSIKFICSCGKHLRARDEMAARRSMCPRCGEPVGVPSLRPTQAGTTLAPLTPLERRRLRGISAHGDESLNDTALTATLPAGTPASIPATLPPRRKRKIRIPRSFEAHWYQCVVYLPLCGRLLLGFAFGLTILSGVTVLLMAHLPGGAEVSWRTLYFGSPFLLMAAILLPSVCGTVECALTSALAGKGPGFYWTGHHLDAAFMSCLRWLYCFLAGPIGLAALAAYYWLNGGDLKVLDQIILAELGIATIAYWLLAVVAVNQGGRFRDANPVRVARLVHRLRFRAIVPVFVFPLFLLADGGAGLFALSRLHQEPLLGWPILACAWMACLCGLTFMFRLLGVWCYRGERPA